jgi:hypothetical protein
MKVSGIRHRHLHDDTNIRGFIRSHFYFFKVLLCLRVSISMKVSSIQQKHLHATNTFGFIQSHLYFIKLLLCLHVSISMKVSGSDTDTYMTQIHVVSFNHTFIFLNYYCVYASMSLSCHSLYFVATYYQI